MYETSGTSGNRVAFFAGKPAIDAPTGREEAFRASLAGAWWQESGNVIMGCAPAVTTGPCGGSRLLLLGHTAADSLRYPWIMRSARLLLT
jgi:hypothetical protein